MRQDLHRSLVYKSWGEVIISFPCAVLIFPPFLVSSIHFPFCSFVLLLTENVLYLEPQLRNAALFWAPPCPTICLSPGNPHSVTLWVSCVCWGKPREPDHDRLLKEMLPIGFFCFYFLFCPKMCKACTVSKQVQLLGWFLAALLCFQLLPVSFTSLGFWGILSSMLDFSLKDRGDFQVRLAWIMAKTTSYVITDQKGTCSPLSYAGWLPSVVLGCCPCYL